MGALCYGPRKDAINTYSTDGQDIIDRKNLKRIYKFIDGNESGRIETTEITQFFETTKYVQSEIWRSIDANQDGTINSDEFNDFLYALLDVAFDGMLVEDKKTGEPEKRWLVSEDVAAIVIAMIGKQLPDESERFTDKLRDIIAADVKSYNNGHDHIVQPIFRSFILRLLAANLDRPDDQRWVEMNIRTLILLAIDQDPIEEVPETKLEKLRKIRGLAPELFYKQISKDFAERSVAEKMARLLTQVDELHWSRICEALFRNSTKRSLYTNTLVSPLTASSASIMLAVLSTRAAQRDLVKLLGIKDIRRLDNVRRVDLFNDSEYLKFIFANCVWTNANVNDEDALTLNKTLDFYVDGELVGPEITRIPEEKHSTERADNDLDAWCSKSTSKNITSVVDKMPAVKRKLVMPVSVMYVEANFPKVSHISKEYFNVVEDQVMECPYMHLQPQNLHYIKNKTVVAVDVPLANEKIRAILALSRKDRFKAPTWEDVFKGKSLQALLTRMQQRTHVTELVVPQARIEWTGGITDVLQNLGVREVTTKKTGLDHKFGNVELKDVVQKVVVNLVGEGNTKSVVHRGDAKSLSRSKKIQIFKADRPFFLMVYYTSGDSAKVLLAGHIKKLPQYGRAVLEKPYVNSMKIPIFDASDSDDAEGETRAQLEHTAAAEDKLFESVKDVGGVDDDDS